MSVKTGGYIITGVNLWSNVCVGLRLYWRVFWFAHQCCVTLWFTLSMELRFSVRRVLRWCGAMCLACDNIITPVGFDVVVFCCLGLVVIVLHVVLMACDGDTMTGCHRATVCTCYGPLGVFVWRLCGLDQLHRSKVSTTYCIPNSGFCAIILFHGCACSVHNCVNLGLYDIISFVVEVGVALSP